jgi:dipeptidyl aminopeptidase/acylaminoacyl peptidase
MPIARRLLLALALTGLTAVALPAPSLLRDGLPHPDPQIASELPRFLTAPSAHFVDWLSDGSMLISSEQGDATHLGRLRAALGEAEAVAPAPVAAMSAVVARPYTSDAFAYVAPGTAAAASDSGAPASEMQLSLQQLGGAARLLGATRAEAGRPAWAHDGRQLAFIGADNAVDVIDTAETSASARQVVAGGSSRWRVLGWSIDDQTLLLGRDAVGESEGGNEASFELYLAAVKDGALQPVSPPGVRPRPHRIAEPASEPFHAGAAVLATEARFASDGRTLLVLTRTPCGRRERDASNHFQHLCYSDPVAGDWRAISAAVPHDVELFDSSPDGSSIAYTLNDDGVSRLMLHDQRLQLDHRVDALPPGQVTALRFDPTGKRLALGYESPGAPPEVDVLDPGAQSLVHWTKSDATLAAAAPIAPQIVHFPTWDELDGEPRQLSALLFSPGVVTEPTPRQPVVIWLCGTGGQQCRAGYNPFVQYLVQRLGLVVLAANVRDASAAGPRDDAVRDVGALLVWIGSQPQLDSAHVAILGEGYGSYLALASLAQFGDRLGGAVAAFPPRFGPLPKALSIRRPVLLVQGLADTDVPAYQIAQLREALRAGGVPVQYLAADDEGRRFMRPANREAYCEAAATFLARLLHSAP